MVYVEGPRRYRITDTDHGVEVLIASYIMMVNTILSILARAGIKFSTARKWSWDDTAAALAMLFAIGHSVSMARAYDHGMGKHIEVLNNEAWEGFLRALYASNVFYIAAIILAKISILLFIRRLTPSPKTLRICTAGFVFFMLWGSASVFVWLFACGTSAPWRYDSGKCINLGVYTRATTILDVVTDVFLVVLPVYIFGTINFQKSDRLTVIGVFSTRIFIVIPSIIRILNIEAAFESPSRDITWTCVPFELWTSIAVHFSVISASIPCIRPFLRSLESGLMDLSMRKHPRLECSNDEIDKSLVLTTITGWSARLRADNYRQESEETSAKTMHKSFFPCSGEQAESERQDSINSDAEFSRQLRPDWAEHKIKIQSTRTFPQFGTVPAILRSEGESDTSKGLWGITMIKETNIRYEEDGRNVQEIRTSNVDLNR